MEPTADGARTRRRVQVDVRTLLLVLAAVLVALLLAGLIDSASRPLKWGIACALLAALVSPLVDVLDRRLPHALAVIIVVAGLALTLIGAWVGIATTIVDNVDRIVTEAPAAAAEIEANSEVATDFGLAERVTTFVDEIERRFGLTAQLGQSTSAASTALVTGILMLFLVIYGRRFVSGAIAQIDDEARRSEVRAIARDAFRMWSHYVWAMVAQVVALTILAWPLFWWLDLPGPFVLALALGVLSAVPYVGIPFAGLGVMLFAAATTDVSTIVTVALFVAVASLVEILIIRKRVDAATLYVGPAVPLIVALLGWQLDGLGGALYGSIAAILGLAILRAARLDDGSDDHDAHDVGVTQERVASDRAQRAPQPGGPPGS